MRVQGVSPFLFTFQLVAFNYASYPALSMHCGPAWTCSSGVARSSRDQETSPFRDHRAPGAGRFCCRAGPPGPPACTGPLASWRGDFPQCLALSATLLLPQLRDLHSMNKSYGFDAEIEHHHPFINTQLATSRPDVKGLFFVTQLFFWYYADFYSFFQCFCYRTSYL